MKTKVVDFNPVKSTENTIKYKEAETPGQAKVMGLLYLQKWFVGNLSRQPVRVTIEIPEGTETLPPAVRS